VQNPKFNPRKEGRREGRKEGRKEERDVMTFLRLVESHSATNKIPG
jgi:hypothetical protein